MMKRLLNLFKRQPRFSTLYVERAKRLSELKGERTVYVLQRDEAIAMIVYIEARMREP